MDGFMRASIGRFLALAYCKTCQVTHLHRILGGLFGRWLKGIDAARHIYLGARYRELDGVPV